MSKSNPEFTLFDWVLPIMQVADNPTPTSKYKYRYIIIVGGRGSGKSNGIVDFLLYKAFTEKHIIVCARQVQKSIATSVYALLKRRISELGMSEDFVFTRQNIICKHTGSIFEFIGLESNIDSIKSIDNISYFWIEEGHFIKHYSWEVVKPSVRANNSQIIVTMNPMHADDALYRAYLLNPDKTPANAYVKRVNWNENPYFPKILDDERKQSLIDDIDMYNHIWEGELLKASDSQIFRGKWTIEAFTEPPLHTLHCYYGLDFGFSRDPSAAVRCYIKDDCLYITHEFYHKQVLVTELGRECTRALPSFEVSKIVADSSRPDAIAQMRAQGYMVEGSIKGKGSVEDGIQHLKSFKKIIIHERCKATIDEFKHYSYKIDPRSGDITRIIDDKAGNDHIIDALRYALERVMKRGNTDYSGFNVEYPLY